MKVHPAGSLAEQPIQVYDALSRSTSSLDSGTPRHSSVTSDDDAKSSALRALSGVRRVVSKTRQVDAAALEEIQEHRRLRQTNSGGKQHYTELAGSHQDASDSPVAITTPPTASIGVAHRLSNSSTTASPQTTQQKSPPYSYANAAQKTQQPYSHVLTGHQRALHPNPTSTTTKDHHHHGSTESGRHNNSNTTNTTSLGYSNTSPTTSDVFSPMSPQPPPVVSTQPQAYADWLSQRTIGELFALQLAVNAEIDRQLAAFSQPHHHLRQQQDFEQQQQQQQQQALMQQALALASSVALPSSSSSDQQQHQYHHQTATTTPAGAGVGGQQDNLMNISSLLSPLTLSTPARTTTNDNNNNNGGGGYFSPSSGLGAPTPPSRHHHHQAGAGMPSTPETSQFGAHLSLSSTASGPGGSSQHGGDVLSQPSSNEQRSPSLFDTTFLDSIQEPQHDTLSFLPPFNNCHQVTFLGTPSSTPPPPSSSSNQHLSTSLINQHNHHPAAMHNAFNNSDRDFNDVASNLTFNMGSLQMRDI